MAFPQTVNELNEAGYKYSNHSHCRGCGGLIQWWTTPNGKKIPLEVIRRRGESTMQSHFSSCPKASNFRRQENR